MKSQTPDASVGSPLADAHALASELTKSNFDCLAAVTDAAIA
ncbi:MAG: hypothetical protein ABIV50_05575 [Opitutus sp.]